MNHLMIDGYVFEFEGVFFWQTAPSVWSDQLQNCLCCRDGVGLGGHRVLRDRSHLVPDTGRHLTCANVSTPGDIHTPISEVSNYISPSIPSHVFFFLYLSASFNTFSDKFPSLLHFLFFSLLLQTLSNSNLQFSICLLSYSVSITPPRSLCLPSYQTNVLDPPKKYISLDVSLFLLHCHVFLELRSGLRLGAGLMGPETWI